MTELVAVSVNPDGRTVYHDLADTDANATPACGISKRAGHEFETVPSEHVSELDRCTLCSGAATASRGQGSTLAARLAAAGPEEVSLP